jgi:hypothetical protein
MVDLSKKSEIHRDMPFKRGTVVSASAEHRGGCYIGTQKKRR